ncbi:MAG TPA: FHA domain-containing protein [Arenimonas sp.]|uniref:FHA domain-containing protein n=1 Tax=Arenimonas sp. TaxID=1872635 RepID=UPI002C724250|nr:FHA domain-containing protein [Arenimonas sp.]HMB57436.1 FHA domain-containing protein [Arenimonas sp.]
MQLTFPNGEHPGVAFDHGEMSIGSRAGLGISIPGHGLASHHASIIADRRGLWLRVPPGTPGVHLNARPVRRTALLRVGDQLCLEQVQVVISDSRPETIDRHIPPAAPPALPEAQHVNGVRVALRGVSGPHFGRCFTLTEVRVVGRANNCDIHIDDAALAERHAQFELHGDRVVLRALSPGEGSVVNGVPVQDAVLAPGDQITMDQHRFVLEGPGLPSRGQTAAVRISPMTHTQTLPAVKVPLAADRNSYPAAEVEEEREPLPAAGADPGALWWLIAAAAVLAAALTALLVYSPRMGA